LFHDRLARVGFRRPNSVLDVPKSGVDRRVDNYAYSQHDLLHDSDCLLVFVLCPDWQEYR
jgi:hypothetical protein